VLGAERGVACGMRTGAGERARWSSRGAGRWRGRAVKASGWRQRAGDLGGEAGARTSDTLGRRAGERSDAVWALGCCRAGARSDAVWALGCCRAGAAGQGDAGGALGRTVLRRAALGRTVRRRAALGRTVRRRAGWLLDAVWAGDGSVRCDRGEQGVRRCGLAGRRLGAARQWRAAWVLGERVRVLRERECFSFSFFFLSSSN